MGGIFFDPVTVSMACNESEPLPASACDVTLDEYFGRVSPDVRSRLDDMALVFRLHCACWGTHRHLDGAPNGRVRHVDVASTATSHAKVVRSFGRTERICALS